jgi:hypothetical protein
MMHFYQDMGNKNIFNLNSYGRHKDTDWVKEAKQTDEVGADPFDLSKKERKKKKEIQKENTIKNKKLDLISKNKIIPEKLDKKVYKDDVNSSLKLAMK